MDRRVWCLLVLLIAPASAQETISGPDVVLLVHHPFPDDADPLGIPYGPDCDRACDAFIERHGARDPFRDGIAFPGFIADGQVAMEGLPDEGAVFLATLAAYEDAVERRLGVETPITIRIQTNVEGGQVDADIGITTATELGDGLSLWAALVEDPVHFEPPAALSNGVFEHPFTLRWIDDLGPVQPTPSRHVEHNLTVALQDWDPEQVRLAVWVEQGRGSLGTFEPGEVVQAASHPILSTAITQRTERAVLVEAYSASWCDPCLIGDEALEELAAAHGLPTGRDLASEERSYLRAPALNMGLVAILAAGTFALFALVRLGGRHDP